MRTPRLWMNSPKRNYQLTLRYPPKCRIELNDTFQVSAVGLRKSARCCNMKRDGPISDLQGTNPSHSVIETGLNNLGLLNREVVILIPAYIYMYIYIIYIYYIHCVYIYIHCVYIYTHHLTQKKTQFGNTRPGKLT